MKSKKIILTLLVILLTVTSNITNVVYGLDSGEHSLIYKDNHVVSPLW